MELHKTTLHKPKTSWKTDETAGFLVFLIALPLCLGVATASGFPPVAGLITAIVGGIIGSLLGSAALTIKGPAAGLIVIALGAVTELGQGDMMLGYRRALAVGVAAAIIQIAFSQLKVGRYGSFFPPSVVHGMLAAIGVIIISKQAHVALGVIPEGKTPFALLAEIPHSIANLNPAVALIGGLGLLILFGLPLLKNNPLKRVPAPVIVLLIAIPLATFFDFKDAHDYAFMGNVFTLSPKLLISLPATFSEVIATPDFSALYTLVSVKYIAMFALVGSIETLLSDRAVEHLDPEHHEIDLDRDLLVVGWCNLISSCLGGLPMISEIVRSSANINAGATSRLSNLTHGVLLLLSLLCIPRLLEYIPLSALAALLIFTGFRLAHPREFLNVLRIGPEQLLLFSLTLLVTLATDLLLGVAVGILAKLLIHLINGAPLISMFTPRQAIIKRTEEHPVIEIGGSAVFTNYMRIKGLIEGQRSKVVTLDFSETRLVDHTVLENLYHLMEEWKRSGRQLRIEGLSGHEPFTSHPLSARKKRQGEQ